MGPLVPDIISNHLNLIVALIIGIFFGAILEQAGFSSSRKLVGLFYGYDFTVLRVFFTAGIVAMVGVMALSYFGYLDINLVYINPTYLWSAIIGGLIMGLGFVLGGYCPGTSFCAASIGKIDAMVFIGGVFVGVLIFNEGYPLFEPLYKSAYWGSPRIFDTLGMSQNIFAFLMVAVALLAFWFTLKIENKVNKVKISTFNSKPLFLTFVAFGIILSLSAYMLPDRKDALLRKVNDENYLNSVQIEKMTVDELAFRIMDEYDNKLQIIDFRNLDEYKKFALPKSIAFTIDNFFEKEPNKVLTTKSKINVFVANDEITEKKIALLAKELGYNRIKILDGGLEKFKKEILEYKPLTEINTLDEEYSNRFRSKASKIIPELIKNNVSAAPVEKKQKRVIGGC